MLPAEKSFTTVYAWRVRSEANRDISGVTPDQRKALADMLGAFGELPGVPLRADLRIADVAPREVAVLYRRPRTVVRAHRQCAPLHADTVRASR